MIDAFKYLHQSSEIEKLASIDGAFGRREEWLKEEAVHRAEKEARLAAKQRAVDEREALLIISTQEAMEQAVLQREEALRAEAARVVYLRVQAELMQVVAEREEAKRAEAERLEAERLEAERIEAERLEAERAEAARQEAARVAVSSEPASSSDSRITSVEKALERVQEEQAIIRQKMDTHEADSATMKGMLSQILAKLSGSSSSEP
jgi:hypothetical protein